MSGETKQILAAFQEELCCLETLRQIGYRPGRGSHRGEFEFFKLSYPEESVFLSGDLVSKLLKDKELYQGVVLKLDGLNFRNYPEHVHVIAASGIKPVAEYFREKYPEEVHRY